MDEKTRDNETPAEVWCCDAKELAVEWLSLIEEGQFYHFDQVLYSALYLAIEALKAEVETERRAANPGQNQSNTKPGITSDSVS